ncbi:hypothetical protein KW830_05575 [Comamonas sp. CMM03]|uniref:hypothetical protein n=1 Tax=Comamonas sp. CMM03 TaxID=2854781 RepID=UPI001C468D8C|nr:hypothetical protein [Comamonas sp. CMM03]MBV7417922.1 hypothetical protein [Comamonas sp. CMM03]
MLMLFVARRIGMSANGVIEAAWRKASNSQRHVRDIKLKYAEVLVGLEEVASEEAQNVPDLSVVTEQGSGSAVVKSFAGESRIRLAWAVNNERLGGVAVVAAPLRGGDGEHTLLHVHIPAYDDPYINVDGGERVVYSPFRPNDFFYTVLMTIVRKQIDISTLPQEN